MTLFEDRFRTCVMQRIQVSCNGWPLLTEGGFGNEHMIPLI